MKRTIVAAGTAMMLFAGVGIADDAREHPDLKYRHHAMEAVKDNLGAMIAIMKGQGNAAEFDVHADALAGNAAAFMVVASHKVEGGETLPAAWENYDDFAARLAAFSKDASALAALGDSATPADRGAALKQLTSNCKACHKKYRKDH